MKHRKLTERLRLIMGSIAVAAATISTGFCGCAPSGEASRDPKPDWFLEPPAEALEQASQAITAAFGASSKGTNYDCFDHLCTCDTALPGDCLALLNSGECALFGGTLRCEFSPELGRSICSCQQAPEWCKPFPEHRCPLASYFATSGVWKYDGICHVRLTENDRVCDMAACPPGPVQPMIPSAQVLADLRESSSHQTCSGVETGFQTDTLVDGYYRTPAGAIHRKYGKRACQLSWTQYHDVLHDPAYSQMNAQNTSDFQTLYSSGPTTPPLPCNGNDM